MGRQSPEAEGEGGQATLRGSAMGRQSPEAEGEGGQAGLWRFGDGAQVSLCANYNKQTSIVMARFRRAIHALADSARKKDVDGPDKPGHDGNL